MTNAFVYNIIALLATLHMDLQFPSISFTFRLKLSGKSFLYASNAHNMWCENRVSPFVTFETQEMATYERAIRGPRKTCRVGVTPLRLGSRIDHLVGLVKNKPNHMPNKLKQGNQVSQIATKLQAITKLKYIGFVLF